MNIGFMKVLPFAFLAVLLVWHVTSWHYYRGVGNVLQQAGGLAAVIIIAALAFFTKQSENATVGYILKTLDPVRPILVGGSCFILGGLHFISLVRAEPVILQMGYLIAILAYFETANMALRFQRASSGDVAPVTAATMRRLAVKQMSILGMTFVLAIALFYLSLMAILGFRETWSVALLAAVMILALVLMTRARHL
ncbi:MAG: hypothetical protein PHU53_04780 [Thermoplasmata archaeon]|nr:hypothetical protein [Thermoplasmata archaeon]